MPGNHGDISLDEQNGCDIDNKKTTRKKKDVEEVNFENGNQLAVTSISNTKKRFIAKIRRNPKSPKRCSSLSLCGSRKGGCLMRPRRTEELSSSSPPSDTNDESFTPEMLRVMLETNDFFSSECNPHR